MWDLVLALHFVLCVLLILTILLQSGKGSDMGAAFGGSSQTVFGASGGATILTKITTYVAIGFLVTSLSLAYLSTQKRDSSVVKDAEKIEKKTGVKTEGKNEAGTSKATDTKSEEKTKEPKSKK